MTPVAASTAASISASGPDSVKNALPPMPRPSCISTMRTAAALTAASAARIDAATVVVSTAASDSMPAAGIAPRTAGPSSGCACGRNSAIDDAIAADLQAGAERLVDGGDLAGDQHQELARAHRPAVGERDRRALDHGVGDRIAARDRRELDQRQRGTRMSTLVVAHTKRKCSLSVQRRSRVKLSTVVKPSPVGDAIVNDV